METAGERERVAALEEEVERLRRELIRLRNVIRGAGDIIVTSDRSGRILEFSEGAEALLGYRREEVLGRDVGALCVDPREHRTLREKLEKTGLVRDARLAVRTGDGRRLVLSVTLSHLRDANGKVSGTIAVAKDITKRLALEHRLRRRSITDALTGLYNQGHFYHVLEFEKERAVRLGHPFSLLLFDLDGFKEYNDRHGHKAGDVVLRGVARILFSTIRKELDTGFRYGGDEFTVILPGATAPDAAGFAERVRRRIEDAGFEGVRASLGVSEFAPRDPSRQIVEEADQAMYASKRAGGNRVTIWEPGLARGARGEVPDV